MAPDHPRHPPAKPPLPARLVMAAALLPGVGQLLNHQPTRAVTFVFFMMLLGWVSFQFTTPTHSFVGRHAGGIFIYAISILDAYRWARYRSELFLSSERAQADTGAPPPG